MSKIYHLSLIKEPKCFFCLFVLFPTPIYKIIIYMYFASYLKLKTHGSESQGEERVPNIKCATNYCVPFTRANVFVIWRHNHSQSLSPRQLLNPNCRHKTFLPTLTNTPKKKVVHHSQYGPNWWIPFLLFFPFLSLTEIASSPFTFL